MAGVAWQPKMQKHKDKIFLFMSINKSPYS